MAVKGQLVFRMQFAVCNSPLNSQLHSRMQFAIQNILQCVYLDGGSSLTGGGSKIKCKLQKACL